MPVIRIGSGRLSWKSKLIIGLVLLSFAAAATFMALVAIGMLLFMLPVVLTAAVILALFPKRRRAQAPPRAEERQVDVLEGRFRVVDASDTGRGPGQKTHD